MTKKLTRLKKSPIAGVCAGFGKFFDVDPTIFRLLFAIGILTPYPAVLTYLICWIAIPKEKIIDQEL